MPRVTTDKKAGDVSALPQVAMAGCTSLAEGECNSIEDGSKKKKRKFRESHVHANDVAADFFAALAPPSALTLGAAS